MKIAILLSLTMSVAVAAAPMPIQLEQVLDIGSDNAQTPLKWGMTQAEIQSILGSSTPIANIGLRLQTPVEDIGCRYVVILYGNAQLKFITGTDFITGIGLEYETGPLEQCKARLEQLLNNRYGSPSVHRDENGGGLITLNGTRTWPLTQSHWETPTTCINLSWQEDPSSLGSRLRVTLGDRRRACGYDDQVIITTRPNSP